MNFTYQPSLRALLASAWFATCIGLLIYAYLFRDAPEMPTTFTYGLIVLTFPLGLPAGAIVGLSMSWLYSHVGLPYHVFGDLVPSWVVMVLAAYVQWFVLVPTALRAMAVRRNPRP